MCCPFVLPVHEVGLQNVQPLPQFLAVQTGLTVLAPSFPITLQMQYTLWSQCATIDCVCSMFA